MDKHLFLKIMVI